MAVLDRFFCIHFAFQANVVELKSLNVIMKGMDLMQGNVFSLNSSVMGIRTVLITLTNTTVQRLIKVINSLYALWG